MCCLFPIVAPTQGKNVEADEFQALSNMLVGDACALPEAQEYRNDLVQPAFLALEGVPPSKSTAIMAADTQKPDPNAPATDDQWKKAASMVA